MQYELTPWQALCNKLKTTSRSSAENHGRRGDGQLGLALFAFFYSFLLKINNIKKFSPHPTVKIGYTACCPILKSFRHELYCEVCVDGFAVKQPSDKLQLSKIDSQMMAIPAMKELAGLIRDLRYDMAMQVSMTLMCRSICQKTTTTVTITITFIITVTMTDTMTFMITITVKVKVIVTLRITFTIMVIVTTKITISVIVTFCHDHDHCHDDGTITVTITITVKITVIVTFRITVTFKFTIMVTVTTKITISVIVTVTSRSRSRSLS